MQDRSALASSDGKDSISPGPGAYCEAALPSGPAHSIPAAGIDRVAQDEAPSPGPGQYGFMQPEPGPAYTIPAAQRTPGGEHASSQSPGPGEYHKAEEAAAGPAYSIPQAAAAQKSVELQPGPADYGKDVSKGEQHGPAYSMAGKCVPTSSCLIISPMRSHVSEAKRL